MARSIPYNIPLNTYVLREAIGEYRSPNDKISRMQKEGELIRLKKGMYVANPTEHGQEISRELIANNLYGPSYVSFQSALSYHGLIPERVRAVISATTKRAKSYSTPLGLFQYITMPLAYYPIGVTQVIVENQYAFLMASPEKALCDLIISTAGLRFQSAKAASEYLHFDLRINFEEHPNWDIQIIQQCARHNRKTRELNFLIKTLRDG